VSEYHLTVSNQHWKAIHVSGYCFLAISSKNNTTSDKHLFSSNTNNASFRMCFILFLASVTAVCSRNSCLFFLFLVGCPHFRGAWGLSGVRVASSMGVFKTCPVPDGGRDVVEGVDSCKDMQRTFQISRLKLDIILLYSNLISKKTSFVCVNNIPVCGTI
jgi:hypothetical protein